jgi:hypothetical protein
MEIKLGTVEYRPGFLQLGGLLMLGWCRWSGRRSPFKFYRPDETDDAHYIFWGPLEIVWNGPKSLRRVRELQKDESAAILAELEVEA